MVPFSLTLKHAGKAYPLPDFDPSNSALAFKDQIYHLTGVPADKVKVPVKGGMLKVRCIHPRLLPAPAPTAHPLSPPPPRRTTPTSPSSPSSLCVLSPSPCSSTPADHPTRAQGQTVMVRLGLPPLALFLRQLTPPRARRSSAPPARSLKRRPSPSSSWRT